MPQARLLGKVSSPVLLAHNLLPLAILNSATRALGKIGCSIAVPREPAAADTPKHRWCLIVQKRIELGREQNQDGARSTRLLDWAGEAAQWIALVGGFTASGAAF